MQATLVRLARCLALSFVCAAAALACSGPPAPTLVPVLSSAPVARPDPLPLWNEGQAKRAILAFIDRVTSDGLDRIPIEERIAVFDNDGTLWQERPVPEGAFTVARLEARAASDPAVRERPLFKAVLTHDEAYLHRAGEGGLLEILAATHSGMTDEAFAVEARAFLDVARHPRFGVRYTELVYTPMLELMTLLRRRGFTTYLCSGGDVDFMRTISQDVYGIPPQQVIGSRFEKALVDVAGKKALLRKPVLEALNDKEGKPVGIDRSIGRRPVFAAGNVRSGGDIAMLEYTADRDGPAFGLVVLHDDATREFAYGEPDNATLQAARARGFTVVSMQRDWASVFAPKREPNARLGSTGNRALRRP